MNNRRTGCWMVLALLCAACTATDPARQLDTAPASRENTRERVERSLGDIERGMSLRNWDRVQRFFSRDYYGGMSELRNSIEDNWRNERNINLQFILNRLNEQDGLLNAQVRWNKSYVDSVGVSHKKSGVAEFVLKPERGSYQIVKMSGDRPF